MNQHAFDMAHRFAQSFMEQDIVFAVGGSGLVRVRGASGR